MKLYVFRTVRLSIARTLFTVHSAMVYVIQVCTQLSSKKKKRSFFFYKFRVYIFNTVVLVKQTCYQYTLT